MNGWIAEGKILFKNYSGEVKKIRVIQLL